MEAALWRPWVLCLPAFLLLWSCSATTEDDTAQPAPTAAPGPVGQACGAFSGKTCDQCIQNASCLWCNENSICMDYPVRSIIPSSTLCPLSEARWGVCWVNFQALIISIAVVAGLLLLTIAGCCCYCCYCRRRGRDRGRLAEEEERFIRDQEEKRLQSLQRKLERKEKHDEIRKKYGLLQDSDHPYSRYENE
ncbi:PREDICTED: pituitary tumor-transforming gene 1 protein-interacting protein-like [Gekko japonicus]|uniref:Pituitary tumor-transforming gene 1 protein-interacting protein-like n=1 Tax=Gekko japonicus TaxID=146911 RepID=A0ABM1KDK7_GEKJA|nr:PREDICTED: pituitary tumor-transforming gene 1 protein-interacting protein-like [Gekko japonicus]